MKQAMKKISLVVALVILALVVARNVLIKAAITNGVKAVTGLQVDIDRIDVGILRTTVEVNGLRVLNPPDYADRVMVDLPELYVDYDVVGFLKGKIHLETLRLTLSELVIVTNEQGQVNVHAISALPTRPPAGAPTQEKRPAQPMNLAIDSLELNIGRVVYKDYSKSHSPVVRVFNVDVHERYQHITSPQALASMIVMRALAKTTIARLTHLDMESLRGVAERALGQATSMATDGLKGTTGAAVDRLDAAAKAGGDAAEQTVDALKGFLAGGQASSEQPKDQQGTGRR